MPHKDPIQKAAYFREYAVRRREHRRAYLASRAEHINQKHREYLENHPDCRERINAKRRTPEYRAKRMERLRKDWDKMLAQTRAWRENNKELFLALARVYNAKRRGAPGKHTKADVDALWEKQQHRCAVPDCPHPIALRGKHKYHLDHIKPIARGGTSNPDNLQILCATHNMEKHAKDEYEWAQEVLGKLFI